MCFDYENVLVVHSDTSPNYDQNDLLDQSVSISFKFPFVPTPSWHTTPVMEAIKLFGNAIRWSLGEFFNKQPRRGIYK